MWSMDTNQQNNAGKGDILLSFPIPLAEKSKLREEGGRLHAQTNTHTNTCSCAYTKLSIKLRQTNEEGKDNESEPNQYQDNNSLQPASGNQEQKKEGNKGK